MRKVAARAALVILFAASSALGDESPPRAGQRVRIRAGDAREIPGVITLGSSVAARGQLVVSNETLVAAKVPGQEELVCLPRPRTTHTGRLLATDDETLTIRFDGQKAPFKVPRSVLESVDLSAGKQGSRGKNTLIGLAIGAAAGALLGASTNQDDFIVTQEGAAAMAAAALGALGAGIGLAVPLSERWERVPTAQVRVGVDAHGRPGISLCFSF
jgi:hypothetical protein